MHKLYATQLTKEDVVDAATLEDTHINGHLRKKYDKWITEVKVFDWGNKSITAFNCDLRLYEEVKERFLYIKKLKTQKKDTRAREKLFGAKYGFQFRNIVFMGTEAKITEQMLKDKVSEHTNGEAIPFVRGLFTMDMFRLPFVIFIVRTAPRTQDFYQTYKTKFDNNHVSEKEQEHDSSI